MCGVKPNELCHSHSYHNSWIPPPTEKKSFKKIEVRAVPSFILQLDYSVASQALSDCKLWKIGTIDPNDRNSFWC